LRPGRAGIPLVLILLGIAPLHAEAPSVSWRGYLMVRWEQGEGAGWFSLRRARLGWRAETAPGIRAEMSVELTDLGEPEAGAVRDLVVTAGRKGLGFRAGQFKKSFLVEEGRSVRRLPVMDRGLLSRTLRDRLLSGRDVGVEGWARFRLAGWRTRLRVGVANGEGPLPSGSDDGAADVWVYAEIRPAAGWRLVAYRQWKGVGGESLVAEGAALRWRHGELEAEGEAVRWELLPEDPDRHGWGVRALLVLPVPVAPRPSGQARELAALRVEFLDPDDHPLWGRGDRRFEWTPTLLLRLGATNLLRLSPRIRWYQDPARATQVDWRLEWQVSTD
jgi:hypothetical protein